MEHEIPLLSSVISITGNLRKEEKQASAMSERID